MVCGKGKFMTARQYHHTSSARVHSQARSLCTTTSQFHREHLASHIIITTTTAYIYRETRGPIFLNSWQKIAPSSTSRTSVLITHGTKKSGVCRDLPVNGSAKGSWRFSLITNTWRPRQPGHSGETPHNNHREEAPLTLGPISSLIADAGDRCSLQFRSPSHFLGLQCWPNPFRLL